jgi:hypothetical protein
VKTVFHLSAKIASVSRGAKGWREPEASAIRKHLYFEAGEAADRGAPDWTVAQTKAAGTEEASA